MDDSKKIEKALTKMVDKFTSIYTQYENGIGTRAQVSKNACDNIAVLSRLREVDALKVDTMLDGFVSIVKDDESELSTKVDTVCTELYNVIRTYKE